MFIADQLSDYHEIPEYLHQKGTRFIMSTSSIFQQAKWVTGQKEMETPAFRKEFAVHSVEKAVIHICGLGFFKLFFNGKIASDELFVPWRSNYGRPVSGSVPTNNFEGQDYRYYYVSSDVTHLLQEGENALGVIPSRAAISAIF